MIAVKWCKCAPSEMEYLSVDCNRDLYSLPDCDLHRPSFSFVIQPMEEDQDEEDEVEIVL